MKYLQENKVIYNKPRKNGNSFYIWKRNRETISSPIDKTPDTLDKFIDATLFTLGKN